MHLCSLTAKAAKDTYAGTLAFTKKKERKSAGIQKQTKIIISPFLVNY